MSAVTILQGLIDDHYGGSQAAFARAIGRSPSQVNQWLSGHRRLDLKGQKIIENALRMPGIFAGTVVAEPVDFYPVKQLVPPEHPAVAEILRLLKATDDTGKHMALAAVRVALQGHQPQSKTA